MGLEKAKSCGGDDSSVLYNAVFQRVMLSPSSPPYTLCHDVGVVESICMSLLTVTVSDDHVKICLFYFFRLAFVTPMKME